jgi:hypothetical protein
MRAQTLRLAFALPLLMVAACSSNQAADGTSSPQQQVQPQLAQQLIDSTAPRRPLLIRFAWSYKDESMHFNGKGAVRVESPYRARTDLFGPRGETLMRSVVIGDELSVPPNVPEGLLPPVSLGWATMGVLRPQPGSQLELTAQRGDTLTVGYAHGQEHWRYRFVGGRIRYAEWTGPNASKRSIELRGTSRFGLPAEAVYRDWAAFRELVTTVEEVNESASFPPDTWDITR